MSKYRIAVVGIGKISIDQHLPVIAKSDRFELAATVSQRGVGVDGVPVFKTQAELFEAMPDVEVVANCTPPAVRQKMVAEAFDAGKHLLIEKPPATTVSEMDAMVAQAGRANRILFATWHSQFNPAVDRTKEILAAEGVKSIRIDWRESVRKWHPGQDWVWEPGGFGVCDPGINALSILTKIMPEPVFVESSELEFPANRATPIDAQIRFRSASGNNRITAGFNWLETSGEIWTLAIETAKGNTLNLEAGGTRLLINGEETVSEPSEEYERIYDRFANLLDQKQSDTHYAPLKLMADIFLMARRKTGPDFEW